MTAVHENERRVAAALAGHDEALARLAETDVDGTLARRHRAGAALYLEASERGIDGPAVAAWRRDLATVAAQYILLDSTLAEAAAALHDAGIRWMPLKGYDLATRVYRHREARTTSDLDLLIAEDDLDQGRQALIAAGWQEISTGPLARRYLHDEGYAWQALSPSGALLELHFRLWGTVPRELAREMTEAATPDPSLPSGGNRLARHHAYLAAAVHIWLTPPPRAVLAWQDLVLLATDASHSFAEDVIDASRRWGLQLPVFLASRTAAALWDDATCKLITDQLRGDLRLSERWAARATRRQPYRVSLGLLTAARLFARRPFRHGWRILWRRLWAHPGIVESATEPTWPWVARRLWFQLSALGLTPSNPDASGQSGSTSQRRSFS